MIVLFAVREGVASSSTRPGFRSSPRRSRRRVLRRRFWSSTSPDLPAHLAARVLDEAAGNPLALIELPAAAPGPTEDADALPLPRRLEQAFAARLAGLDPDTRRLLLLAALEDGELPEACGSGGLGARGGGRAREARGRHVPVPASTDPVGGGAGSDAGGAPASACRARRGLRERARPRRLAPGRRGSDQGPTRRSREDLDAAAERARLRGGRDVALAALERAAELSVDRGCAGAAPLPRRRARVRARPSDRQRAAADGCAAARPSSARARAGRRSTSSRSSQPGPGGHGRRASSASRRSSPKRAMRTRRSGRSTRSLFALTGRTWTGRRGATSPRSPSGSPARRTTPSGWRRWRSSTRSGRATKILRRVSRTAPLDVPGRRRSSTSRWPRLPCGPRIWRSRSSGPHPPATAPMGGSLCSRRRSSSRPGRASAKGRHALAITAAAEGVQLAQETRQVRYALVGQLAEAIAAVEMGADEAAERLIGEAEETLLPLGVEPIPLAGRAGTRPPGARAGAVRRGARAPAADLRPERRGIPGVRRRLGAGGPGGRGAARRRRPRAVDEDHATSGRRLPRPPVRPAGVQLGT